MYHHSITFLSTRNLFSLVSSLIGVLRVLAGLFEREMTT